MKIAAFIAAVFLIAASPADARHRHHVVHCKKGFHQVKRHGKVRCVRRKPSLPQPVRVMRLRAKLDPSYTRDPLNPFKVTYTYSAAAQSEVLEATAATSEPASLPSGVLALYSDGALECAINVGGSVGEGECAVNYKSLGAHRVTTVYSSGEQSATATEVEQIEPLPSHLEFTAVYEEREEGPVCEPFLNRCTYGTLKLTVHSTPTGAVQVRLPILPANQQNFEGEKILPVEFRYEYDFKHNCYRGGQFVPNSAEMGSLSAVVQAPGYTTSEVTAPVQFEEPSPEGRCP